MKSSLSLGVKYMSKPSNKDFAYYLSRFLTVYLPSQRNLSTNTISSYRDTFKLFLSYCSETLNISPNNIVIANITKTVVDDFIFWLENTRNCSKSTCNSRLGAFHSFFSYLQYEAPEYAYQCQQVLSIRTKKVPEPAINYLTVDGVKALLEQPDTSTKSGIRDLAILTLMYDTGARVSELTNIRVSDIRLNSPATIRLTGKGRKTRIVPLLSNTATIISNYIKIHNIDNNDSSCFLFLNREGKPLSRFGIGYILDKYCNSARKAYPSLIPDTFSPHCLRHSKAMHLLQAGVNLVYIRDLLGHVSVKTTEVYAKADDTFKREALEKANPLKTDTQFPQWTEDNDLMDWLRNIGK